ncbi:DNA-3-methyladenine glycosylase [Bifidobacterium bombi]|uniref:Putative 3-methyladenine DNA glycosylase n=1 Tax=Bifidobacterium bombi DSM 19703 TaxID=1341695 RepID=A0A080N387_9BIFI|nr:DNA-3-methyladenine glycosylase [Bifidobacterium bombi]KFF31593.1 DNA-3-methyladenine glycosylase [Bifidobacterium bombi DSM 19703]
MFPDFLDRDADTAARGLLGCRLVRRLNGRCISVRIVETEAYDQLDPASHTYRGMSERNRAMFGPAGHAYIYLVYGMHLCLNITAGSDGFGAGVLIRAAEPADDESADAILARYSDGRPVRLCLNGPGKLTRALGIGMDLYGHDLQEPDLQLETGRLLPGETILATARIGVARAKERLRRYIIDGNLYCSR